MLKWSGIGLAVLTILWMFLQREALAWTSLSAGLALASSIFISYMLAKPEKPLETPVHEKLEWQLKLDEAETKASQTIDGLNREVQKLQQKTIRSEERCISYQKLVEVHQQEIEKLRQENETIAQQLIQKERKLNELTLTKMEPDLFDHERRQAESINRELKKQLHDTKSELAELAKKKKTSKPELEFRDLLS